MDKRPEDRLRVRHQGAQRDHVAGGVAHVQPSDVLDGVAVARLGLEDDPVDLPERIAAEDAGIRFRPPGSALKPDGSRP